LDRVAADRIGRPDLHAKFSFRMPAGGNVHRTAAGSTINVIKAAGCDYAALKRTGTDRQLIRCA
jgi:hypothetical protein